MADASLQEPSDLLEQWEDQEPSQKDVRYMLGRDWILFCAHDQFDDVWTVMPWTDATKWAKTLFKLVLRMEAPMAPPGVSVKVLAPEAPAVRGTPPAARSRSPRQSRAVVAPVAAPTMAVASVEHASPHAPEGGRW